MHEPGPPLNENVMGRFAFGAIAILGIGHKEDLGARLLALRFLLTISCLLLKDHRPGCDRVLDLPATDLDTVFCDNKIIFWSRFLFLFLFFLLFGLLFVCHVQCLSTNECVFRCFPPIDSLAIYVQ